MGWDNDRYGFNSMHNSGYGIVMMILCIALFVSAIWLLARLFNRPKHHDVKTPPISQGRTPLEVIDMRLAKGEMSKDDYLVAQQLLSRKGEND
ncbi:MAG: hypothetical protein WCK79_06510 [Actinomycetes bacterium]